MVYFAKDHSRAFRELIYMKYLKVLLTLLLCSALLCACAPDENAQTAAAPTASTAAKIRLVLLFLIRKTS